jgi:hypothetical protein
VSSAVRECHSCATFRALINVLPPVHDRSIVAEKVSCPHRIMVSSAAGSRQGAQVCRDRPSSRRPSNEPTSGQRANAESQSGGRNLRARLPLTRGARSASWRRLAVRLGDGQVGGRLVKASPGEVTPCAPQGQPGKGWAWPRCGRRCTSKTTSRCGWPEGLPRRAVTGTRSSTIQGDGKGWPKPAHSRLSVEDSFCGAPVARITVIR